MSFPMTAPKRKRPPRRSQLEMEAEILRALAAESLSTYNLIYHVGLNRRTAKRSIGEVLTRGLIEAKRTERGIQYSITAKGTEWLSLYKNIVRD